MTMPFNLDIGEWVEKVWGSTKCIYQSEFASEHHLNVKAGGYCSFHYHRERANRFIVQSGCIRVVCAYGWDLHFVLIGPDNVFDVPSLVPHQFQVLKSGQVIEQYWADRGGKVEESDIERLTTGNMAESDAFIWDNLGVFRHDGSIWKPEYGILRHL